jgi:hypothetical protein
VCRQYKVKKEMMRFFFFIYNLLLESLRFHEKKKLFFTELLKTYCSVNSMANKNMEYDMNINLIKVKSY